MNPMLWIESNHELIMNWWLIENHYMPSVYCMCYMSHMISNQVDIYRKFVLSVKELKELIRISVLYKMITDKAVYSQWWLSVDSTHIIMKQKLDSTKASSGIAW